MAETAESIALNGIALAINNFSDMFNLILGGSNTLPYSITPLTTMIQNLIGVPTRQFDIQYIIAGTLLILFNIGIFALIINFQKSFSRRGGK